MMKNLKLLKTITAGVALALALYPQAWAECATNEIISKKDGSCVPTSGSCGTNCRWDYNVTTKELSYTGTGSNNSGVIESTPGLAHYDIVDLTINEGITQINKTLGDANRKTGSPNGTLTIPSTVTSMGEWGFYSLNFGRIEINSPNLTQVYHGIFRFNGENDQEVVVSIPASDNLNIVAEGFWSDHNEMILGTAPFPAKITFLCKGEITKCESSLASAINYMTTGKYHVETSVTNKLLDSHGNIIEEYDDNGNCNKFSYTYDGAGNITAAYKNGVATYKRTSYTPAEAAKAVRKGNNNTITFTFK